MYELYQMNQAWMQLCSKQLEPMLNNPIMDWYMDLYTEAALRMWFWPGTLVMLEDQIKEFTETFSVCKV